MREAKAILQKTPLNHPRWPAPGSSEARTIDRARPQEKLAAAKEALRILQQHRRSCGSGRTPKPCLALAERELGNYEAGWRPATLGGGIRAALRRRQSRNTPGRSAALA